MKQTSLNQLDNLNQIFSELKEAFHSVGRFDDANVKLDEISKLLAIKLFEEKRRKSSKSYRLSIFHLKKIAIKQYKKPDKIAGALHFLFKEIANHKDYRNPDGTSIFGSHPRLNIQETENGFAEKIVRLLNLIELPSNNQNGNSFDILNEAFGHFVRDSFRNTKEDAQYMTPEEVTTAMVDIALHDIVSNKETFKRLCRADKSSPFLILDPTCGVGTFLTTTYKRLKELIEKQIPSKTERCHILDIIKSNLYGQDKVDRMIRLAKLNLMFLGIENPKVFQGNSIIGKSSLDNLIGKVDLIFTNPPFGAKFEFEKIIKSEADNYPMVRELFSENGKIDSEILLIDRYLQLLKPGGKLLAVLPNNISSGKSKYQEIRNWVKSNALLRGIIELPAETFAQAGTRTKTDILYLQKKGDNEIATKTNIFMGICHSLGYKVVERKGGPIKKEDGENQLLKLVSAYKEKGQKTTEGNGKFVIISHDPAATIINNDFLINGRWAPNFYQPKRLSAIKAIKNLDKHKTIVKKLKNVANFVTKERKSTPVSENVKCISILHVNEDGLIDMKAVDSYKPKWPGLECYEGDVLISKINPHIQRVCVIPKSKYQLTCSTEFEILRPNKDVLQSPFILAFLLKLPNVYRQIVCLTAGTSSSHSRIKDTELKEVLLPIPNGKSSDGLLKKLNETLKTLEQTRYKTDLLLQEIDKNGDEILLGKRRVPAISKELFSSRG
ncbi:MAG TPA: N-6 DNA methylase [Candidatus Bathyarchaeia archaeon]|nr:N-6 DNA methylase [Candidatus Bathyarchaeia archaeon]